MHASFVFSVDFFHVALLTVQNVWSRRSVRCKDSLVTLLADTFPEPSWIPLKDAVLVPHPWVQSRDRQGHATVEREFLMRQFVWFSGDMTA